MPYVARRYRVASHVGGVRKRLAKAIIQAFTNEQIEVRCDPKNLWPASGIWKQPRMDVMRWEGQFEMRHDSGRWQTHSLGSWNRMTECLRGFSIVQDGWTYEVHANGERDMCSPSERYVLE